MVSPLPAAAALRLPAASARANSCAMHPIYLIRHGETALNANRTLQPAATPLSERGLAQAQRLAERLRPVGTIQGESGGHDSGQTQQADYPEHHPVV